MPSIDQAFKRRSTHPIVIDLALLHMYGSEWMTWDGEAVFQILGKQLGFTISGASKSKIYAILVLHSNHAYWEDWRAFEAVSWGLSGQKVDFVTATPLNPTPLVYGYRTASWIDPEPKFSDEVSAYAVAVFLNDQYSLLPPELSSLQDRLNRARPDIVDRSHAVKSAILSNTPITLEDLSDDPVKVELTRHRALESAVNILCSKQIVLEQARSYGLGRMAEKVLGDTR